MIVAYVFSKPYYCITLCRHYQIYLCVTAQYNSAVLFKFLCEFRKRLEEEQHQRQLAEEARKREAEKKRQAELLEQQRRREEEMQRQREAELRQREGEACVSLLVCV
jgi:hypothetical protein